MHPWAFLSLVTTCHHLSDFLLLCINISPALSALISITHSSGVSFLQQLVWSMVVSCCSVMSRIMPPASLTINHILGRNGWISNSDSLTLIHTDSNVDRWRPQRPKDFQIAGEGEGRGWLVPRRQEPNYTHVHKFAQLHWQGHFIDFHLFAQLNPNQGASFHHYQFILKRGIWLGKSSWWAVAN